VQQAPEHIIFKHYFHLESCRIKKAFVVQDDLPEPNHASFYLLIHIRKLESNLWSVERNAFEVSVPLSRHLVWSLLRLFERAQLHTNPEQDLPPPDHHLGLAIAQIPVSAW